MIEKINLKHLLFIGAIGLVIVFLFSVFGGSGKDRTELQASTDSTMGAVNVQHQLARSQLDAGTGEIDRAGDAIRRAYELINRCQRGVERSKEGTVQCQNLIAECRASLDEVKRIIQSVENSNGSGT